MGKISEQEKIQIIQKGFQQQAEGKISLKKYYESTQEYSLFKLKGYSIKYESIRRTKLHQQFKDKLGVILNSWELVRYALSPI